MPAVKATEHVRKPMPRDEIDILIGREPLAPEDAARESAEEIMKSVRPDLDRLFQSLILSASVSR